MNDRSDAPVPTGPAPTARLDDVRREIATCVVGRDRDVDLLLCAVLASRHVLVESVPGLGKTLLVKSLAATLGCDFRRIQFTPDMLPADILGSYVYDPSTGAFDLRKGPVFTNVILADEINRAPAKVQSALLEVMQEQQVTIEGRTMEITPPFFVFATQNPIEHEGVYPLPQAQLDRFGMRLLLGYPPPADERAILAAHRTTLPTPSVVLDAPTIVRCQRSLESVTIADEILALVVDLANATRNRDDVILGASPRVGLDLLHLGRARAVLRGRDHVLPDDVKVLFPHVVNHRIHLTPRAELAGVTCAQVIDETLAATKLV